MPRRPEKYASRDASSIALSSAIFSPRVRNFSFFFFLYQRPVPKTLSFDLSLSLSLFFPTEKKKMDVVWRQKRRTSGKKEKERNRSSGAIKLERPFMVGNLLKNRSPAPLSPALVDVGACYTCFERNAWQRRAFEEE